MTAVVQGWAVRTAIGVRIDEVVSNVLAGQRGEGAIPGDAGSSRHDRFLPRLPLLAVEAAHEAAAQAGLVGSERVGVFAGVGGLRVDWGALTAVLGDQRTDGTNAWELGLRQIHPFWMLRNLSNNGHALLAADLGARGDGMTFGGAVAGADAIAAAIRSLGAGAIDAAVVVAYDTLLSPESIVDLRARGVLEDGVKPAEAAGALVLARDGRGMVRIAATSAADGETGEPLAPVIARVAARVSPRSIGSDDFVFNGTSATGAIGAAAPVVHAILMGELLRRGQLPAGGSAICISTGAPGLASAVRVEVL